MKRLRSIRLRSWVLPVLLGALALRALVPQGFMPGSGELGFESSMCSNEKGKKEKVELPAPKPLPHCEYCIAPLLASLSDRLALPAIVALSLRVETLQVAQLAARRIERAQTARAPPHAS